MKLLYYIWSVQVSDSEHYNLQYDFSQLNVPDGAQVIAEAVSGSRHGEVTKSTTLGADKIFKVRQPAQSAMLITVSRAPQKTYSIKASSDATIAQGHHHQENYGKDPWLNVQPHSDSNHNQVSYLKFELPELEGEVNMATLDLVAKSGNASAYDRGFLVRIYKLDDQNWNEDSIKAENAPNLHKTVSSAINVGLENYPVGHVTCFHDEARVSSKVTEAIKEAYELGKKSVSFMLIREMHWIDENTDLWSAHIASKESGADRAPQLIINTKQVPLEKGSQNE